MDRVKTSTAVKYFACFLQTSWDKGRFVWFNELSDEQRDLWRIEWKKDPTVPRKLYENVFGKEETPAPPKPIVQPLIRFINR